MIADFHIGFFSGFQCHVGDCDAVLFSVSLRSHFIILFDFPDDTIRLPNILTNRLVLNLRNIDQKRSNYPSAIEAGPFEAAPGRSRFLGNIGEALDSVWLDADPEDDDPRDDESGEVGSSTTPMTPTDGLTDAESPSAVSRYIYYYPGDHRANLTAKQ